MINRYFVPVADEVGHLQFTHTKEKDLFRKIVNHPKSHYADRKFPSQTHQGIYAVAPSGELLASVHRQQPGPILDMLREALNEWKTMDPDKRFGYDPLETETYHRNMDKHPDDGLVVSVFSRDLPGPGQKQLGDWRDNAWNMDYAWFKKHEARSFLPEDPEEGKTHSVPDKLVERLARFHLIDSVRGQVPPFSANDVKEANLTATVTSVSGDVVSLEFSGSARMSKGSSKKDLSYAPDLKGKAKYDLSKEAFDQFELVAAGPRTGTARFNRRDEDLGPALMGHVIVLVPMKHRKSQIAPSHFNHYDW